MYEIKTRPQKLTRMSFEFSIDAKYDGKWTKVHMEPSCVEHLRYQAAICQRDIVTDTILSCTCREQLFNSTKSTCDPMLCPFFLLLFANMNQHDQVLQWLNSRCNQFTKFPDFGTLMEILREKWPRLRSRLLQIVHDGH